MYSIPQNPPPTQVLLGPIIINTIKELDTFLDRHPYLRDRPNFKKQHLAAQQYLFIKHLQHNGGLEGMTLDMLSERTGQDRMTISHWRRGSHRPRLITNIKIHEAARRKYEDSLPQEARLHRLDPSWTYHLCKTLRDTPQPLISQTTSEAITILLKHNANPYKVLFTEFRPYHHHGPRWINKIAHTIKSHREEIEDNLNIHLGLTQNPNHRIRLGVVNNTLYIWHRNTNPDNPLNYYANEAFTFKDPHLKQQLLQEALNHLNFPDPNRGFLKLIDQITDHPKSATKKMITVYDLRNHGKHRDYILGESLHFLLDATNKAFADIRTQVKHIGIDLRYGIYEPQFHEGEKRDELRARLLAIYLSDGHVYRESSTPQYTEKERDRIDYVMNLLKATFGDVHLNLRQREQGYVLNSTTVIGRQLEDWGVRRGAKHLQSFELPSSVKNRSTRIKRAYIEELIPEEGSFIYTPKTLSFSWRRTVVLDAGPKNKDYDFVPKITKEQKEFIDKYGKKSKYQIRTSPREEKKLRMKQLEYFVKRGSTLTERIIAAKLIEKVERNRCPLLDDEVDLVKSLGIEISSYSEEIRLFKNGRVSISWVAVVNGQDDVLRWAILAPPSSGRKREAVAALLSIQEKKADLMFEELKNEGLIDKTENKWWKPNETKK